MDDNKRRNLLIYLALLIIVLTAFDLTLVYNRDHVYKKSNKSKEPIPTKEDTPKKINSYKVGDNTINLIASYDAIELKETIPVSDITIAVFDYMNETDDAYNEVIYAIGNDNNVIWYEKAKEDCEKDASDKCISTIGWHFTQEYGYTEKPYRVDGNKIYFISQNSKQDSTYSACNVENKNDYFYAEYEIDYLGDNVFSELKVKKGVTTNQYIKNNKINCESLYEN